ncbi:shikimate kinase [Clostridia bacterium]|nr:shikimate kinase [Clostridia bacterium]
MKYILLGIPNVGKSTLGKRAAEELGLPFYDTDLLAVERIKPKSMVDMLRPSFVRRMIVEQVNAIIELAENDESAIIATGASLPSDGGCADILPKLGTVIHIKRSVDSARDDAIQNSGLTLVRIGDDGKAVQGSEINMSAKAVELYASDLPLLESISDYAIENDGDINNGADKLVALIRSIESQMPISD